MNSNDTTTIIVDTITTYGAVAFGIIVTFVGVSLGYLVFKFGWKRLFTDQSLEIFGYYPRKTPYKGYNRFRSKKWNFEHTM